MEPNMGYRPDNGMSGLMKRIRKQLILSEAEKVTGPPQNLRTVEEPQIEAEDVGLEDYSEEELNGPPPQKPPKSKSKDDDRYAVREVPAKESVDEARWLNRLERFSQELFGKYYQELDSDQQQAVKDRVRASLREPDKDVQNSTPTRERLEKDCPKCRGEMKRVDRKWTCTKCGLITDSRQTKKSTSDLYLCNNCSKTFRNEEAVCTECRSNMVEKVVKEARPDEYPGSAGIPSSYGSDLADLVYNAYEDARKQGKSEDEALKIAAQASKGQVSPSDVENLVYQYQEEADLFDVVSRRGKFAVINATKGRERVSDWFDTKEEAWHRLEDLDSANVRESQAVVKEAAAPKHLVRAFDEMFVHVENVSPDNILGINDQFTNVWATWEFKTPEEGREAWNQIRTILTGVYGEGLTNREGAVSWPISDRHEVQLGHYKPEATRRKVQTRNMFNLTARVAREGGGYRKLSRARESQVDEAHVRFSTKTTEYGSDTWNAMKRDLNREGIVWKKDMTTGHPARPEENIAILVPGNQAGRFMKIAKDYNSGFEQVSREKNVGESRVSEAGPYQNPEENPNEKIANAVAAALQPLGYWHSETADVKGGVVYEFISSDTPSSIRLFMESPSLRDGEAKESVKESEAPEPN